MSLTERQTQVVELVAAGVPVKQIGQRLDPPISENGVREHIKRIAEAIPGTAKPLIKIASLPNLVLPEQ